MKVKSIVKDYLTGKEYVAIKNKEDLPIKGYANVYLYNARTGKLELEAHTPNLIMPEIYAWLKSYQWDKFCTGAYNKANSYNGYWEMDNIYLVTSASSENERVNIFNYSTTVSGNPGQQIGWANKSTYTGSDTQRGTPNTAESFANNTRIHWVFDWPTHAANGTFQTIIWGNQLQPYANSSLVADVGITVPGYSGFGFAYCGGYLYALQHDGTLYKLTTNGQLVGSSVSTGISAHYDSGFGMASDGSYLYAITRDGLLYKLNTNGSVIGSAVSTGINTGTQFSTFGLACDGTYLYALSYNGTLYKLTIAGSLIGSGVSVGISTSYQNGFGLVYHNNYLYAINSGGYMWRLTTAGQAFEAGGSVGISIDERFSTDLASDGDTIYALTYQGKLYKPNTIDHYFARTLLASPVTKNSTQTMKIQYDFVYG